jgi:hypothetical protein
LKFSAKIQKKCPITLDSFQKNAKKVNFFTKFAIFGENRREKRHFLRRVRDWNGTAPSGGAVTDFLPFRRENAPGL